MAELSGVGVQYTVWATGGGYAVDCAAGPDVTVRIFDGESPSAAWLAAIRWVSTEIGDQLAEEAS